MRSCRCRPRGRRGSALGRRGGRGRERSSQPRPCRTAPMEKGVRPEKCSSPKRRGAGYVRVHTSTRESLYFPDRIN